MILSDQSVVCGVLTPPLSIDSAHLELQPRWYQKSTRYYPQLLPMENEKKGDIQNIKTAANNYLLCKDIVE